MRVGHDGHQPWPALVELAADVEQQACAIDERLVLAARAPVALRRKLVIDLTVQVVEVEHVTGRIVRLANRGDHRRPDHATSVKQIRERLDALDDALVELEGPAIPITEPAPVIELTPGEARPPLAWLPPAPRRRSGGRARGTSAR